MLKVSRSQLQPYGFTVLTVASALLLTRLLQPLLEPTVFVLFFPAVMISALYGGTRTGLLASVLSALTCKYLFIDPVYSLSIPDWGTGVRLVVFLLVMLLITTICSALRTARQQTEVTVLKLRASEERYRILAENVPQLVWIARADGFVEYVNQRWLDYTGLKSNETLGWGWQGIIHPDDLPSTLEQWTTALAKGTSIEVQYRLKRADGIYRWHIGRARPLLSGNGEIVNWFGACTDIYDQKQVEEALQQSEARFRRVVESNMIGMGVWTSNGEIAEANDALLELLGYTREDIQTGTLSWAQLTPPEYQALDEQVLQEIATVGICTPFEKEYFRKDGSRVPILIGGARFEDTPDQGVFCVIDLTERKQVEEALQDAHQKLNFHVENTPLAVIERDRNFHITRWSQGAERIFGWSAEEVIGKGLNELEFIFAEDTEAVKDIRTRLMNGTEKHNISHNRSYRKDGSIVHCEWYNSALLDESGNLVSVLSLVLDVTQRKQAEAERMELLEREKAARTQAEAANRIKDEFLAVLSHELRTPLNPILGWSKLLQTRKLDEATMARGLETIERNAKLQTQLIEDLLDVSRILRGKLSLKSTPVDLVGTIEAALETVCLAASAKSIDIQTIYEPDVGQVLGDAGRLQQIVWNLLSNAVKFTPNGGRIDVRLSAVSGKEQPTTNNQQPRRESGFPQGTTTHYAHIQVSDTGKGISRDFLPYVFDYFRQENSSTTRAFGGLGLGLAIVQHLVELHGGIVRAESPGEGQGATFTIWLPLIRTRSEKKLDNRLHDAVVDLTGIRVLVVDDEADMREFLAFMLREYGAEVTVAASANEVLQILGHVKPDILLSDIGMPDADGYMLIRQVRAIPAEQGGQVPAIALTAYAGEADQNQALSAGFQKHIAKPVEPTELAQVVANLVRG